MRGLDPLLRLLHILPPVATDDENGRLPIDELQKADDRGEARLQKAEENLSSVSRGKMTEEEFWALIEEPDEGIDDQ